MNNGAGTERWDVIVVGAGPAGSSAARTAAEGGASVRLLDRAEFPLYKTCGGGLIGGSRAYMPRSAVSTIEREIVDVGFSRSMGRVTHRKQATPFLAMVPRTEFDQAHVDAAVAAGATFRDGVLGRSIDEDPATTDDTHPVSLATDGGPLRARIVVGADGTGGRIGRYIGLTTERADLGLESEIEIPADDRSWDSTVLLDWGPRAGTYAWVFPKKGVLTVGVIEAKGKGAQTRDYLDKWIARVGLPDAPVRHSSGHMTQWRTATSPVRKGRVIAAGETAGLLEPWTREGISFALRSGTWAGHAAARAATTNSPNALGEYERRVEHDLFPEIRVGSRLLAVYERVPGLIHLASAYSRATFRYFVRFCRGDVSLADALKHRSVRLVLNRFGK